MKNELKQAAACKHCHSTALQENEQGQFHCLGCGRVQESIAFSGGLTFGNQTMDGQVVNVNQKYNRGASERRLAKAKETMEDLRNRLPVEVPDEDALMPGMRIMRHADSLGFFDKGKTVETYAAAAYYIALRFIKAPYLLIDFSDKMNINLFKLARCFLKLYKFLDFQSQLPIIDPSLYIHRYCKTLDMGNKTKAVTLTAIKLIQRMERDWMCQGRRPSSLCGAAILIATKIHDVRCSTGEICKTVFVCDETIRRRLEEFKKTSVAKMTKEEFEEMGEEEEGEAMDPPAFQKARLKSKEMQYKREIEMQIASLPHKEKGEKIPWEQFKDNLNIPEEFIARQMRGVERELQQARERFEEDSMSDARSYTEDIFEESPSEEPNAEEERQADEIEGEEKEKEQEQEDDGIESEEIEKFILTDEERKLKKNIWIQHNSAWLEKEKARAAVETTTRRKQKPKESAKPSTNPFQAIQKGKLANKLDPQELKTLLGSQPVKRSLKEIVHFDPFAMCEPQL